ncbi:hypothetical protein [Pistricoccus aurantiacus]|uniref:hypothetical protein n=1 Tax=Pistricoccus aurantiacus TaxID=1883414 RepID=UPI003642D155
MHRLHRALYLVLMLVWIGAGHGALAVTEANVDDETVTPFSATYRLHIDGWPSAHIHHRLSHQPDSDSWQSEMRAAISIAKGWEKSRFLVSPQNVTSLDYTSGYSLFGMGDNYQQNAASLDGLPDRQAALFDWTRQVRDVRCGHAQMPPCVLHYANHKGEEETFLYRIDERGELTTPAGKFPAITITAWEPDEPDRYYRLSFHRDVPGLLLALDYYRDDKRKSYLRVDRLALGVPEPLSH